MYSGTVIRDEDQWQGHPDVALFKNKIYIVYRQSDEHMTHGPTSINLVTGSIINREGESPYLSYISFPKTIAASLHRLNCPRLTVIGDALWMICDEVQSMREGDTKGYFAAEDDPNLTRVFLWKTIDGDHWDGPFHTNITGILPDKILPAEGGYCIATHTGVKVKNTPRRRLAQNLWFTKDLENGNFVRYQIASDSRYHLCEASLFKYNNRYCCLMRENSGKGLPAFLSISKDCKEWEGLIRTRMFGCHRPVAGILKSGKILITYRENVHPHIHPLWARNTFAYLAQYTIKDEKIDVSKGVILPIDHDNNKIRSDSGYTGWVQLQDESIFIVNYLTGDAPTPYIKWYLIREEDF